MEFAVGPPKSDRRRRSAATTAFAAFALVVLFARAGEQSARPAPNETATKIAENASNPNDETRSTTPERFDDDATEPPKPNENPTTDASDSNSRQNRPDAADEIENAANAQESVDDVDPNIDDSDKTPTTLEFSTEPFDKYRTRLPENYLGHDPVAVYNALAALNVDCGKLQKDQFETQKEYQDRLQKFQRDLPNRVLFEQLKLSSTLAFVLPAQSDFFSEQTFKSLDNEWSASRIQTLYDADQKTFEVQLPYERDYENDKVYINFRAKTKKFAYEAVTVMNVKFKVAETNETQLLLDYSQTDYEALKLTFADVDVDKAKDLTGFVAVLCVVKLNARLNEIYSEILDETRYELAARDVNVSYSDRASLDRPWERNEYYEVVSAERLSFWVYDVRNGEVLAKIDSRNVENGAVFHLGDGLSGSSPQSDDDTDVEPRSSSASFATTPFDPSATKIAPDYAGHDPVAVWEAVQKIADERTALSQNDGETREEFEARTERFEKEAGAQTLFGDLRLSSTFAFGVATTSEPIGDWETEPLRASYSDAAQTLTVRFSGAIHFPRATESTDYFNFRWNDDVTQNLGYGVAFRYVGPRENKESQEFVCSFVDIPDDKGQALTENVGILCVCSPKIKFSGGELKSHFSVESSSTVQKRDSRGSVRRYIRRDKINAVRVDDATFWFYDVRTGDVFAKVPLDDAFRGKPIPYGTGL